MMYRLLEPKPNYIINSFAHANLFLFHKFKPTKLR